MHGSSGKTKIELRPSPNHIQSSTRYLPFCSLGWQYLVQGVSGDWVLVYKRLLGVTIISSIYNSSPATFFHNHHRCENIPLSLVTIASYRGSLTYSWAQFQCWSDRHGLAEDGASSCGRGSLHVGITQWSWSIGECQQPAVTQRNSSIRGECQQLLEIDRYFFFLDWWKFTSSDS